MSEKVERYVRFKGNADCETWKRFVVEKKHPTITEFLTEHVVATPDEVCKSPWVSVLVSEFSKGEPWRVYEYITILTGRIWKDGLIETTLDRFLHEKPEGYELVVEGFTHKILVRKYFRKLVCAGTWSK